jgi:hypothetical protein
MLICQFVNVCGCIASFFSLPQQKLQNCPGAALQRCDLGGTQTRDTQNRNLMLYSTELRGRKHTLLQCKFNSFIRNRQTLPLRFLAAAAYDVHFVTLSAAIRNIRLIFGAYRGIFAIKWLSLPTIITES